MSVEKLRRNMLESLRAVSMEAHKEWMDYRVAVEKEGKGIYWYIRDDAPAWAKEKFKKWKAERDEATRGGAIVS